MRPSHPHPTLTQLRGPYAITSEALCRSTADLITSVEEALAGGVRLIQYRDKWNDAATRERHAHALVGLCHEHDALLIINDDVALAQRSSADGVHIGATDAPLALARAQLGPQAVIGVTCSNQLERALAAQSGGASYVAFGRYFPSNTKPDAPPATLELLAQARAQLALPICVIGGITPTNAAPLIAQGANMIAAVEGVFGATDIEAAARAYTALFTR